MTAHLRPTLVRQCVVHSDREWHHEVVPLALPRQHRREFIPAYVDDAELSRAALPDVLDNHEVEAVRLAFGCLDLSGFEPKVLAPSKGPLGLDFDEAITVDVRQCTPTSSVHRVSSRSPFELENMSDGGVLNLAVRS